MARARPAPSPLVRLLDAPDVALVVPRLAPETLHQLIRHSGLEACGEIVALATPAQLASVLDIDLWRSARPGQDERFDADRFGEWLEVLAEVGGAVAARTVAAMEESLVVAGLSRYVRVLDPASLEPTVATDDEPMGADAPPHDGPECEVGGYLVRGTRAEAWDAILALLLELDAGHPERFHALMRGVRRLSNSRPEMDGLDDLLLEPEQVLHDVAAGRESRRSQQGYSTAADARAFLRMARQRRPAAPGGGAVNPIVAAYFRAAGDAASSGDREPPRLLPGPSAPAGSETLDALVHAIAELDAGPPSPRSGRLLEAAEAPPSPLARLRRLMEAVRDGDPGAHVARGRELAFLANALAAGCSLQGRAFTPEEAADAAASVCQLGLESGPAGAGEPMPVTFLIDHDLVTAFEAGWATLHDEVSMFVAQGLIAILSDPWALDAETCEDLAALRREIERQREAGTPWRAYDALEPIAILDVPAWASLLGLLGECPVLPAALTALLEGGTGAVPPDEFDFIATRAQLGAVREFMERLPEILRG